jgi:hypothetical protein
LHWRRVPPSKCLFSFVRLPQIRQPDNTMASTEGLKQQFQRGTY